MNDIQALLASPGRPVGEEAVAAVSEIVARTRRSLVTPRIFAVSSKNDEHGFPYALIDAEGTHVRVEQDPGSNGIGVHVLARDEAEHSGLSITVNGALVPQRLGRPGHDAASDATSRIGHRSTGEGSS
jgi:hypothetical protein